MRFGALLSAIELGDARVIEVIDGTWTS